MVFETSDLDSLHLTDEYYEDDGSESMLVSEEVETDPEHSDALDGPLVQVLRVSESLRDSPGQAFADDPAQERE